MGDRESAIDKHQMSNQLRKITFQFELANAASVAEFDESLYMGTMSGHVFKLVYNPESTAQPFLLPKADEIKEPPPNVMVHQLISIKAPKWLFIHYYTSDNKPSMVKIKKPAHTETLIDKATFLKVSQFSKNPNIVTAFGSKFQIYTFQGDSDQLNQPVTKEAGGEILAIDVNNKAVCFYANGKYRAFWIETGQFQEISSVFIQKPMVMGISSENFIVCLQGGVIVTGIPGQKTSNSLYFNKGLSIDNVSPNFFVNFNDKVFEFFDEIGAQASITYKRQDNWKPLQVPHIRFATQFIDQLVLFSNEDVYVYGGTSKGTQLATEALDNLKNAITKLQMIKGDDQKDAIVDMFKNLWEKQHYDYCLQIIHDVIWPYDFREILYLFPCIMVANPLESLEHLSGCRPLEEPSKPILERLGNVLLVTASHHVQSTEQYFTSQMQVLDTALFEFYSLNHMTREIDELMSKPNALDQQLIATFFAKNLKPAKLYPARAVYFTHTEKVNDALAIWRSLNDATNESDTRWAYEASFTLREIKQSASLEPHLMWVCKRDPKSAVNALTYPKVEVTFAKNWIQKNCPSYLIKWLDYMCQLDEPPPTTDLIDLCLTQFCAKLLELESASYDLKSMTFSTLSEDPKVHANEETAQKLCEEICQKITKIIHKYPSKINFANYAREVGKTKQRSLLFEMYSMGEMYDEAIEVIFKSKVDVEELQNFCRNAPRPNAAFAAAFNKMKSSNKDVVKEYLKFLSDNLEWVDFNDMVEWIPENTPLEKVDALLNRAAEIQIEQERLAQLRLDIAKSQLTETNYRLVLAQLRNVEVQHNTKCTGCGRPVGNGWVAVSPQNQIYHITCLPRLN